MKKVSSSEAESGAHFSSLTEKVMINLCKARQCFSCCGKPSKLIFSCLPACPNTPRIGKIGGYSLFQQVWGMAWSTMSKAQNAFDILSFTVKIWQIFLMTYNTSWLIFETGKVQNKKEKINPNSLFFKKLYAIKCLFHMPLATSLCED